MRKIKFVLIVLVIIFCASPYIFAQNNDNDDTNDNQTNDDQNNNNQNNDPFGINEDDLFGSDDDMINEVTEADLQDDIKVTTDIKGAKNSFSITGNAKSSIMFNFGYLDGTESPFDFTSFTIPISFGLNAFFKLDVLLGKLNLKMSYTPSYLNFATNTWTNNSIRIEDTSLSLDVRSNYVRVFTELDMSYDVTSGFKIDVDELFLDINANYTVFFRIGKLDLKWGAGYRWSPTDFLNEVKIDPLDPDEKLDRTGLTGIKTTIPLNMFNIVIFIGNQNLKSILDTSVTLRVEFAYQFFETSLTAYYQKDSRPAFGFDFSGGGEFLYGVWDFWNETSFTMGSNKVFVGFDDSILAPENKYYIYKASNDQPFFKSVFGFSYNTSMLPEIMTTSLTFTFEYFYNGEGYSNADMYPYILILQNDLGVNLYQPYQMGRHYIAMSLSLQNIFSLPDKYSKVGLSFNYIINASDPSSILRINLSLSGIDDLSIRFYSDITFAKEGTEFYYNSGYTKYLFIKNLDVNLDPITQEIIGYSGIIKHLFSIGIELSYSF